MPPTSADEVVVKKKKKKKRTLEMRIGLRHIGGMQTDHVIARSILLRFTGTTLHTFDTWIVAVRKLGQR